MAAELTLKSKFINRSFKYSRKVEGIHNPICKIFMIMAIYILERKCLVYKFLIESHVNCKYIRRETLSDRCIDKHKTDPC